MATHHRLPAWAKKELRLHECFEGSVMIFPKSDSGIYHDDGLYCCGCGEIVRELAA